MRPEDYRVQYLGFNLPVIPSGHLYHAVQAFNKRRFYWCTVGIWDRNRCPSTDCYNCLLCALPMVNNRANTAKLAAFARYATEAGFEVACDDFRYSGVNCGAGVKLMEA